MLSLSKGCWRRRPPQGAVLETASVPHSNTAASCSSTCTRWPLIHLIGQYFKKEFEAFGVFFLDIVLQGHDDIVVRNADLNRNILN